MAAPRTPGALGRIAGGQQREMLVESAGMERAPGAEGGEEHSPANNLLTALGLTRGEAAEVLHQHLITRRRRALQPSGPATSAELVQVLRTYATRKAAFGELMRQGKIPPRSTDLP